MTQRTARIAAAALFAFDFGLCVYLARPHDAHADIVKTVVTPVAASDRVVLRTIVLDFTGRTITAYYGEQNADGVSLSGGSQTVPFPDPTPVALGTIKNAVEKALAGQLPALGMTPTAAGTVTP